MSLPISILFADAGRPFALSPAGPQVEPVAAISWVMFGGGALILLLVIVALGLAVFGSETWRRKLASRRLIIGGGIILPVVVLTFLLVWGLGITANLVDADEQNMLRIRVTGEQWWWRVDYLGNDGRQFATANEIVIPAGQPVSLELRSDNVIHSFWVPQLSGKLDMIPGRVNRLKIHADAPGDYYGACAEYCGGPHALMQFRVIALPPDRFDAWRAAQMRPASPPMTELANRGRELFQTSGCGACHSVRGTEAAGSIGPDLTHVGSRRMIAAGLLPNNAGTLAGWISNAQQLKPNNQMPSYHTLSGPELRALAAYLGGLE